MLSVWFLCVCNNNLVVLGSLYFVGNFIVGVSLKKYVPLLLVQLNTVWLGYKHQTHALIMHWHINTFVIAINFTEGNMTTQ